jgi:3D (Asp-Asp-Asp) domain-containing protein
VTCHTGKGITVSGRPSSRETVSVDPRVVSLGTRLVIDKVGTRVAADTGGAIRGRRLEIWESSAAACTQFGRRQLRVWQAPEPVRLWSMGPGVTADNYLIQQVVGRLSRSTANRPVAYNDTV